MNEDINKYSDIIDLPHHISKKHPQMSLQARAAQFAPFAALTGFEDEVIETARLTSERIEIDDKIKEIINMKLQIIQENIKSNPKASFVYFVPDKKKEGGEYISVTGIVKKIDDYNNVIKLDNGIEIPINEIIEVYTELAKGLE